MVREIIKKYRELVMYGIIGGGCAAMDFAVYSLLVWCGMDVLLANIFGVNVGIAISFYLNRTYNFRVNDHTATRFVKFYVVGLTGLGVSTLLLWALADVGGLDPYVAKLVTIVVVALLQFVLNKTITFRRAA